MIESKYSICKDLLTKKITIVVFLIVAFGLVSISLGYILSTTSTVFAQQADVCDDSPPPPPPECPCGDCTNGCGSGCMDADVDGICDSSDNCVGNETIETETLCFTYCRGDEDQYGNCPQGQTSTDCDIVEMHQTCTPY